MIKKFLIYCVPLLAISGCSSNTDEKLFTYSVSYMHDINHGNIVIRVNNVSQGLLCGSRYEISSLLIDYVGTTGNYPQSWDVKNGFSLSEGIFVLKPGEKKTILLSTDQYDEGAPHSNRRTGTFKLATCRTLFSDTAQVQKISFECDAEKCSYKDVPSIGGAHG